MIEKVENKKQHCVNGTPLITGDKFIWASLSKRNYKKDAGLSWGPKGKDEVALENEQDTEMTCVTTSTCVIQTSLRENLAERKVEICAVCHCTPEHEI